MRATDVAQQLRVLATVPENLSLFACCGVPTSDTPHPTAHQQFCGFNSTLFWLLRLMLTKAHKYK